MRPQVRTSGVVTAVQSYGFYMQMPLSDSPNAGSGLSEAAKWTGIFVFTTRVPWVAQLSIGTHVEVVAQVSEYYALTTLGTWQGVESHRVCTRWRPRTL